MSIMSKRNNNNFLSLLLILAVYAFPAGNAITTQEIDTICRESQEIQACEVFIKSDPRLGNAASLSQVLVITVSSTKIQVDEANAQINNVRQQFSGPVGKKRISVCENNYKTAATKFHMAWEQALRNSYPQVEKLAKEGANAVIGCQNSFHFFGPVQKSPFTAYNQNIVKLTRIILYMTRKLGS